MTDTGTSATGADAARMTLVEHLTELRKRVFIIAIAVVVCAAIVWFLYSPILRFLSAPYEEVTRGQPQCGGDPNVGCDLIVTDPLAPILIRLKIAGYGGLALATPIIFYQIWRFVTPGLHKHERRYAIAFGVSAVFLFLLGAAVAWLTVDPALNFLLGIGGSEIQPFIVADKYLTLVMLMLLAFGAAFEFPLLLVALLLVRVINTKQLRAARRWMAVGVTAFAAVITPSADPFSLLLMAIPLYIFYEIAILIGRAMKR